MTVSTTVTAARWAALLGLVALAGPACETAPAAGSDTPDIPAPEDVADAADADVDTGPVLPGLGIDYGATAPGVAPRYDTASDDWTATPWPTDRLLRADGHPDLTNFPNPDLDILQTYIDYGEEVLDGWGLNGSVYVQFGGPLDMSRMPEPQETMQPKGLIQVVNVTQGSLRYGELLPLLFRWYGSGSDAYYLPNTLAFRPVYGFPLAEGDTYCAVVTRGVRDAQGDYLSVASGFDAALDTDPTLAPLMAWLPDSGLVREDIAVATCFTGHHATAELRRVRAFLDSEPLPELTDLEYLGPASVHHEFRGHYVAPNFQAGVKPYEEDGDLRFDADGDPIIQEQESIRFLLMIPKGAVQMPAAGWPIVTYAHGTGGDYETCKSSAGPPLVQEGVAVICIDQPLHGERGPNLTEQELVLYSFNFLNARAGRMSFRQSAIDTMSLTRMIAGGALDIDASMTGTYGKEIRFDPANIHFFGHSHGGLSGALAFGVDPELTAGVLSGSGGILVETILRRTDPFDIASTAKVVLEIADDDFDSFHPTLTLIQMLVDATDPVNYAPYWLHPATGGTAKHLFVTEGTADHATPGVGTEAMCAAAGIPLMTPVAQESIPHLLHGLPKLAPPVQNNITTPTGQQRTAALRQWDGGDHWVALNDPLAREIWTTFFWTLREGFPVTIGSSDQN